MFKTVGCQCKDYNGCDECKEQMDFICKYYGANNGKNYWREVYNPKPIFFVLPRLKPLPGGRND